MAVCSGAQIAASGRALGKGFSGCVGLWGALLVGEKDAQSGAPSYVCLWSRSGLRVPGLTPVQNQVSEKVGVSHEPPSFFRT